MALRPAAKVEVDANNSLGAADGSGPGVATSPGDAKPHDGPRPPWTGGYQSFTPSTPGFPGYEAENRVLPPEVAMAGLRPADLGSIAYNAEERTFDCDASLTDTQVLEFCRTGCLLLPGVVPQHINERACEWLQGKSVANPSFTPDGMTEEDMARIRKTHEPSTILLEDWFIEHVLLQPHVAGALRSLLGKDVALPVLVSHHGGVSVPGPPQGWHQDADCIFAPELNFLEVFYFPQDTPMELGPTELMPGTHIKPSEASEEEEGLLCAGPAGTLAIHHQSIVHRRARQMDEAEGVYRHMLKYSYWRSAPPTRDWTVEPGFDPRTCYYGGHNVARYVAHSFAWLMGEDYKIMGGQGWPWMTENQIGPSMGYRTPLARHHPEWGAVGQSSGQDGYVRAEALVDELLDLDRPALKQALGAIISRL